MWFKLDSKRCITQVLTLVFTLDPKDHGNNDMSCSIFSDTWKHSSYSSSDLPTSTTNWCLTKGCPQLGDSSWMSWCDSVSTRNMCWPKLDESAANRNFFRWHQLDTVIKKVHGTVPMFSFLNINLPFDMVPAPYIFSPKKVILSSLKSSKSVQPWQLKNDEEVAKASGVLFAGEVDGPCENAKSPMSRLLKWLKVSRYHDETT